MNIRERLKELGIELPQVSGPFGAYVPAKKVGNLIFVAGQLPTKDGQLVATGMVPLDLGADAAAQAARQCTINGLAAALSVGEPAGVASVRVYVQSTDSYESHPSVANGASELLKEIFGDPGQHARAAVGVNSLPMNAAVEVEFVFYE